MGWTAERAVAGARDLAPEFRERNVLPDAMLRMFNDALEPLLEEVVEVDPERLLDTYTIPAAVVDADDDIDLSDDGTGTGAYQWLHIERIEALDSSDAVVEEVNIVPAAEWRQAEFEADDGELIAFFVGGRARLRKVYGWSTGWSLRVYGVLDPEDATESNMGTLEYSYPKVVRRALQYHLALDFAGHVGIRDKLTLGMWLDRLNSAREALGLEATRWPKNESTRRAGMGRFE